MICRHLHHHFPSSHFIFAKRCDFILSHRTKKQLQWWQVTNKTASLCCLYFLFHASFKESCSDDPNHRVFFVDGSTLSHRKTQINKQCQYNSFKSVDKLPLVCSVNLSFWSLWHKSVWQNPTNKYLTPWVIFTPLWYNFASNVIILPLFNVIILSATLKYVPPPE